MSSNSEMRLPSLPLFQEALVISNQDPKYRERLLVRVPGLHLMDFTDVDNSTWANHCSPTRLMSGGLPEPGDWVYVMFPNITDPFFCIWMGVVMYNYQQDHDDGDFEESLKRHNKKMIKETIPDGTIFDPEEL